MFFNNWHNRTHNLIFVYLSDSIYANFDSSTFHSLTLVHCRTHTLSGTVFDLHQPLFLRFFNLQFLDPRFSATFDISSFCTQTSVNTHTHTTTIMLSSSILASVLLLVAGAQAHMSIVFPPPFDAKTNVNINAPISAAQFPCNGLLKTGGPSAATLIAGAESKITFKGSASHSGGSCQVALTYDKTNFYVIHSWQGGCPTTDGGSLPFTVPSDAPLGEAVFAVSAFLPLTLLFSKITANI